MDKPVKREKSANFVPIDILNGMLSYLQTKFSIRSLRKIITDFM